MSQLDLSQKEILLIIQSLDHCLATCHNEDKSSGGTCPDCEAAKSLRQKLANEVTS